MKLRHIVISAAIGLTISACSTQRTSLTYFEDLSTVESAQYPTDQYDLRIVPDDELMITVNSTMPGATAAYNLPLTNPATNSSIQVNSAPQQQTYIVDNAGDINFPQIGKLHVAGMTIKQLTEELTSMISKDVIDPIVNVKLLNFNISVLGEVNTPGTQNITRERFTILDALAGAGDLTPYGERDQLVLIREENGTRNYHRLNLNDSKLLQSPYFYMRQNDVLLVQPNAIRKDNAKYNQNNSYKLSVISTIVSASSIVASLVIALAVK